MSVEYTIRGIPDLLDAKLRQRAYAESKSLNAVALEALTKGLKPDPAETADSGLDLLTGFWRDDAVQDVITEDSGPVCPGEWKLPVSQDCGWKGLSAGHMRDLAFDGQNRFVG